MILIKIIGILGVLLISTGIITNRKSENLFYIGGGLCLLVYSLYIKDSIFIILQVIFIISAIYALVKRIKPLHNIHKHG